MNKLPPIFKDAPLLTVKEEDAVDPRVFPALPLTVTAPELIMIPPVPLNVAGHSAPDVNVLPLLYCMVAAAPNVGTTGTVAAEVPSIERIPLTVKVAVVIVLAPVPLMITLLKTEAPVPEVVIVCVPPLKLTVPVVAVKPADPFALVQLPPTVKVAAPDRVTDATAPVPDVPNDILLHTAVPEIPGYLDNPFGKVTFVIASGAEPHDQLAPLFQSVSDAPVHNPGVQPLELTFKTPAFKK